MAAVGSVRFVEENFFFLQRFSGTWLEEKPGMVIA